MNKLIIGLNDKTPELPTKQGSLLIDDGPIADHFLKKQKRAVVFDPARHNFNPLPMSYRQARIFAAVIYGDAGQDTLTARNGKRTLARLLLGHFESLEKIERWLFKKAEDKELSASQAEALGTLEDLLLSPLLRRILCGEPNFTFKPTTIVAKINRAEIGDDDAKVLAAILVSQFKGQVIIPAFDFYARDFHSFLIREKRLVAGVDTISQLPEALRDQCLLMEKVGSGCLYDDAVLVAKHEGYLPEFDRVESDFNRRVRELMEMD